MPAVPTVIPDGDAIKARIGDLFGDLDYEQVAARMTRRHWKTIQRVANGVQKTASVAYMDELATALRCSPAELIREDVAA